MRLRPPALHLQCTGTTRPRLRPAPGYSCGCDLQRCISNARAPRARAYGLRLGTHAAATSSAASPMHGHHAPALTACAWVLMRLRPPALHLQCTGTTRPRLRPAPGYSCGCDLQRCISNARAPRARAYGLRLGTHAAATSSAASPMHGHHAPALTACAWVLMRLRPPALHLQCTGTTRPRLRPAPGYSCGCDLQRCISNARAPRARAYGLRLGTHAAATSSAASPMHGHHAPALTACAWVLMRLRPPALHLQCTGTTRPRLRPAPGYSCGCDLVLERLVLDVVDRVRADDAIARDCQQSGEHEEHDCQRDEREIVVHGSSRVTDARISGVP